MIFTLILIAIGIVLIFKLGQWAAVAAVIDGHYSELRKQLHYQPAMLLIAIGLGLANRLLNQDSHQLKLVGMLNAPAHDFTWLGFASGATWSEVGGVLLAAMTAGTTLVVFLQVLKNYKVAWRFLPWALGWALLFSLTNSLLEEIVFRVLAIEGLSAHLDWLPLALFAAVTFGIPHYFGNPGKLPGVVMASFLGFVMARSMQDTGGILWAWLLHFAQDVPIFTILFLLGKSSLKSGKPA